MIFPTDEQAQDSLSENAAHHFTTHRFYKAGGTAPLLVVLVVVLWRHLQVDWGVRPLGELGVICVPGALAHRHLAARDALPVRVVHADERGVVRGLVFTGRRGRGSGPGAGGASRGEAVGSAGVQACYGHHLEKIRSGELNTPELRDANVFYWRGHKKKTFCGAE